MRAGIQLYTLRDVDEPLPRILERVADAGFDGVEFAYRVPDADTAAVVEALRETGLDVAGAHVGIDAIEEDLEGTVADYERLGCDRIVVPHLHEEYFLDRDGIDEAVSRLSDAADGLAPHGKDLLYHNHAHEFVDLDGAPAFDALIEAVDDRVGFEIDVGLAALGGVDPVSLLERLGPRAPLLHLKDVDLGTGESVPVGRGDVDLEGCADAARAADADWLIYEYEGDRPLATLEAAAEQTRSLC